VKNAISFMTANYVARQTGYEMNGWGHGDRTANEHFRPLETFAERFDALLGGIRALGFDTIDVWGAHLNPEWATEDHLAAAREALAKHDLTVATYALFLEKTAPQLERACDVADALGTDLFGGMTSAPRDVLVPVLRERGKRLGIENHPERTPDEMLEKVGDGGDGTIGVTVDTGWFGTQGYDAARAIEELGEHVFYVHLKDVLEVGAHDTCRWGLGVVPIEECVRVLQRSGYGGAFCVEHEPERFDPTEDIREMRVMLEGWLQ
jgi:sugar phosphate isomerase/epimerase